MAVREVDRVIERLAATQHWVVSREQLLLHGLSPHAVDNLVRAGRLRCIYPGVYQVGPLVAPRAREMAAVLTGRELAVSHHSAAVLWDLAQRQPAAPVDIVCAADRRVRRPGIRPHRCSTAGAELTRIDGIPATTAAMTVIDLSRSLGGRELERMLARGERARLFEPVRVRTLLEHYPGRGSPRRLLPLLDGSPAAFTRSEGEDLLLEVVRSGGLPDPRTNVSVCGYELDFYWSEARLGAEFDGYAFHSSTRAFASDRRRDMTLAAAGIQVVRLTWHQLTKERDRTLVLLAQALARRTTLVG